MPTLKIRDTASGKTFRIKFEGTPPSESQIKDIIGKAKSPESASPAPVATRTSPRIDAASITAPSTPSNATLSTSLAAKPATGSGPLFDTIAAVKPSGVNSVQSAPRKAQNSRSVAKPPPPAKKKTQGGLIFPNPAKIDPAEAKRARERREQLDRDVAEDKNVIDTVKTLTGAVPTNNIRNLVNKVQGKPLVQPDPAESSSGEQASKVATASFLRLIGKNKEAEEVIRKGGDSSIVNTAGRSFGENALPGVAGVTSFNAVAGPAAALVPPGAPPLVKPLVYFGSGTIASILGAKGVAKLQDDFTRLGLGDLYDDYKGQRQADAIEQPGAELTGNLASGLLTNNFTNFKPLLNLNSANAVERALAQETLKNIKVSSLTQGGVDVGMQMYEIEQQLKKEGKPHTLLDVIKRIDANRALANTVAGGVIAGKETPVGRVAKEAGEAVAGIGDKIVDAGARQIGRTRLNSGLNSAKVNEEVLTEGRSTPPPKPQAVAEVRVLPDGRQVQVLVPEKATASRTVRVTPSGQVVPDKVLVRVEGAKKPVRIDRARVEALPVAEAPKVETPKTPGEAPVPSISEAAITAPMEATPNTAAEAVSNTATLPKTASIDDFPVIPIRNVSELANELQRPQEENGFGYTPELAKQEAEAWDRVGKEWEERHGKPAGSWYATEWEGVRNGGRALAELMANKAGRGNNPDNLGAAIEWTPDDGKVILSALTKPDARSSRHELSHQVRRMIARENPPDAKALNDWIGAKDNKWTPEQEEDFVKIVEAYQSGRVTPPAPVKNILDRVIRYFGDIARRVKGLPKETIKDGAFNPEVLSMLNRYGLETNKVDFTVGQNKGQTKPTAEVVAPVVTPKVTAPATKPIETGQTVVGLPAQTVATPAPVKSLTEAQQTAARKEATERAESIIYKGGQSLKTVVDDFVTSKGTVKETEDGYVLTKPDGTTRRFTRPAEKAYVESAFNLGEHGTNQSNGQETKQPVRTEAATVAPAATTGPDSGTTRPVGARGSGAPTAEVSPPQAKADDVLAGRTDEGSPAEQVNRPDVSRIVSMKPEDLDVLPGVQFKREITDAKNGVTDQLKGQKEYNVGDGNTLTVWERADGKRFVVDGHHRRELAQRATRFVESQPDGTTREVPRMLDVRILRESDGWTPESAKRVGVLRNLKEGKGRAVDAADALTSAGDIASARAEVAKLPKTALARDTAGLVELSKEGREQVLNGKIDATVAAGIGKAIPDGSPEASTRQAEALKLATGRNSLRTYEDGYALGREVANDTFVATDAKQLGFEGMDVAETRSTAPERAEIKQGILRRAIAERGDAKKGLDTTPLENESINTELRAKIAGQLGGTNAEVSQKIGAALEFDPHLKQTIADLAADVASGKTTKQKAIDEVYPVLVASAKRKLAEITSGKPSVAAVTPEPVAETVPTPEKDTETVDMFADETPPPPDPLSLAKEGGTSSVTAKQEAKPEAAPTPEPSPEPATPPTTVSSKAGVYKYEDGNGDAQKVTVIHHKDGTFTFVDDAGKRTTGLTEKEVSARLGSYRLYPDDIATKQKDFVAPPRAKAQPKPKPATGDATKPAQEPDDTTALDAFKVDEPTERPIPEAANEALTRSGKDPEKAPAPLRALVEKAILWGRQRIKRAAQEWNDYKLLKYDSASGTAEIVGNQPRPEWNGPTQTTKDGDVLPIYTVNVKTGYSNDPDSTGHLNGKAIAGNPKSRDGINKQLADAGIKDRVVSKHVEIARKLVEREDGSLPEPLSDILFQSRKGKDTDTPDMFADPDEQGNPPANATKAQKEKWRQRDLFTDQNVQGAAKGSAYYRDDELGGMFEPEAKAKPADKTPTQETLFQSKEEQGYREKQQKSPAFKNWFGDWEGDPVNASKVVDGEGNPLIVYHGTSSNPFDRFSATYEGVSTGNDGYKGSGFYFTGNAESAGYYAEFFGPQISPRTIPVYLDLKNPLIVDSSNRSHRVALGKIAKEAGVTIDNGGFRISIEGIVREIGGAKFRQILEERGYDGVISYSRDTTESGSEYVAFRPEQIKSATGNKGTFDPKNPDILFQSNNGFKQAVGDTFTNDKGTTYEVLENVTKTVNGKEENFVRFKTSSGREVTVPESQWVDQRNKFADDPFAAIPNPTPKFAGKDNTKRYSPLGPKAKRTAPTGKVLTPKEAAAEVAARTKAGEQEIRGRGVKPPDAPKRKITFGDVWNAPRTLLASGDVSFIGRQGAILNMNHPKGAAQAAGQLLLALAPKRGEANAQAVYDRIKSDPAFKRLDEAGLHLSGIAKERIGEAGAEENFASEMLERIPVLGNIVKSTERANTVYLDSLRFYAAKQMAQEVADAVKKTGATNEAAELENVARYVNYASGRGDLGRIIKSEETAEVVGKFLGNVMFSPKYALSRFQVFADPKLYSSQTPVTRKAAIRSNIRYAGTVVATLVLARLMGAETETNPESADFGKIKVGDTRFDLSGGVVQNVRFIYRMMKATATGQPEKAAEILAQFGRNKLNPSAGVVSDAFLPNLAPDRFTNKTAGQLADKYQRDKVTLKDRALLTADRASKLVMPLMLEDFAAIVNDQAGLAPTATKAETLNALRQGKGLTVKTAATAGLGFIGIQPQTYPKFTKSSAKMTKADRDAILRGDYDPMAKTTRKMERQLSRAGEVASPRN